MINKLQKIRKIIGLALIVLGISLLPSALVAFIYGESKCLEVFLFTALICEIFGLLLYSVASNPSLIHYKSREGYAIVSSLWVVCSLMGSIPFILSGAIPNIMDAIFETVSGFSTTGCSILTDVESLPKAILFWRSSTHWLGGMGIIVFAMILFPNMGISGQLLADIETPGPTSSKLTSKFKDTAKRLYVLYLFFTVAEVILLMFCGLGLYDSIIQTFGTVGTGGFSNYNDSIAHFNSNSVTWVITLFMFLCGTNFNLYFTIFKQKLKAFFKNDEFKLYIKFIIVASFAIFLNLIYNSNNSDLWQTLTDSVFQVVSILTTTGYSTCDYTLWSTFAQMILFCLFFVGSCTSSTSGGVKIQRISVMQKLAKQGISLKLHPSRISNLLVNKNKLPSNVIQNINEFIFLYIVTFFVASLLISIDGKDIVTSISAVATCLGNVGPGFQDVGPACNFSAFSAFSKGILSFLMLAGRLEVFTLFIVFSRKYWNDNKS